MKKNVFLICSLILSGIVSAQTILKPEIPETRFSVTDYGASASALDNTVAIQKTIDECSAAGGGSVIIPAGTFMCGPIVMKSNINLVLDDGCILKALPYGKGNGIVEGSYPNNGKPDRYAHLISGKRVLNIKVSGKGVIEGDGSAWWTAFRANRSIKRGCLIRFDNCRNIEICGIRLQNAPNVHITLGRGSSDITVRDITIEAPDEAPNSDGIDVWAPNVLIYNCNIACGDDNIAMDSGTKNITIRKCNFGNGHGCSIGSYTAGIENVLVDSCSFKNTESAIRMKSNRSRGGGEKNIIYSNITIDNVRKPIFITSYYPKTPKDVTEDSAEEVTVTTPSWNNIFLRNIEIYDCEYAGIIWGVPELPIRNVVFDNVKIRATKGMEINYVSNISFINGSSISVKKGDAVKVYESAPEGIDFSSGKPVSK